MNPGDHLIYDWNRVGGAGLSLKVEIEDHTPAVAPCALKDRLKFIPLAAAVGITAVNVGPAGPDATAMIAAAREAGLEPVVMLALGEKFDGDAIGEVRVWASRLRQHSHAFKDEKKYLDEVARRLDGRRRKVILEDASRAHPDTLAALLRICAGTDAVVLDDSAGLATPHAVRRLVEFAREHAPDVRIEWSGHNERDLAVVNCLDAVHAGASALHASVLSCGHGPGLAALDHLLVNLRLLGYIDRDLSRLGEHVEAVAAACGFQIPVNYPVFGKDAFRTATGVHAAAIVKAQAKGEDWLADRVYSGVPAGWFGRSQVIDIGPMSGESNVVAWLRQHGREPEPDLVKRIIARAKTSNHILSVEEVEAEIASH